MKLSIRVPTMIALAALAGPLQATTLGFNGIAGGNNAAVPVGFGSNLSNNIPGATVANGGPQVQPLPGLTGC